MVKKFTWSEIQVSMGQTCYYAYYDEEELGFIEIHKPWKKWVWNQNEDIIMSFKCISEVKEKLRQLEVRYVKTVKGEQE